MHELVGLSVQVMCGIVNELICNRIFEVSIAVCCLPHSLSLSLSIYIYMYTFIYIYIYIYITSFNSFKLVVWV